MVQLQATIKRFRGRSSDDKPVTDVPVGSTFRETDTDTLWVWTGYEWVLAEIETERTVNETRIQQQQILEELKAIRLGLELVTDQSLAGKAA